MIEFYFNLHCFHIQYNYYFRNYLPNYQKLSIIILFSLLKKITLIIPFLIASLLFFFKSKKTSYTFNCVTIYSFFKSKNIFYITNNFFFPFFVFFQLFPLSSFRRVFSTPRVMFKFFSWAFYCLNCSIFIMI